ncbi:protein phosphatase 2C domain-containing protein [Nodosilinea sp. LEGE 07298]|uniref:protein phosphatase 2C domain-containing protein n=1 Tax=Nodosilinea sp. LEGE 07298 TaxID=2777970 RepID=UPI0018810A6D|nr:protein phosphatase 2C domain-containing protein [Nodosilinea sp. LEGE 07298]MBE9107938.1 protein phosphatase 2C domain-containing protein [Nodosilinea sp. LEGE 07298]
MATHSGSLIAGRFLVWNDGSKSTPAGHQIWLDTRPDHPTPSLEQIPASVLNYLKLFSLAQHIPRPYAYLTPEQTGLSTPVLMLDMAPIGVRITYPAAENAGSSLDSTSGGQIEAVFLPTLAQIWTQGSALQQLNWLRQVASLWPVLATERVVATLLDLDGLRADGALLRLTTLVADGASPTLTQLGQRWHDLVATAQPSVRPYLKWLVKALKDGHIASAKDLLAEIEGAIQTLGQGLLVTVDWAADTDQGPTRDRNEDACYPEKDPRQQRLTGQTEGVETPPLLLVCDGIGGHEQGNVASQTAIKLLQQELEPLTQQPHLSLAAIAQRLRQALILANDAIAARNNDEQRSARARMGTTVVVALVHFPYVSIAHVGDSRAYRVSPRTCYQITVDDDVASREAQMGYALYSEAAQLPSGGALIQALGISDSDLLYPTVQHLLLDDRAVLLLCSDGLSDYDRVEALAPYLVAPLTSAPGPISPTVEALIQQANRLNGHDNVTVGLMRFIPQPGALPTLPPGPLRQANPTLDHDSDTVPAAFPKTVPPSTPVVSPTTQANVRPARSGMAWGPFLGGIAVVLTGLGAVALAWDRRPQAPVALQPLQTSWSIAALAGQPLPATALAATVDVPVGSYWQSQQAATPGLETNGLLLRSQPGPPADAGVANASVATGSVLRVVSRQTTADNVDWVRLRVCSIPSGASLDQRPQETSQPPISAANPNLSQQLLAPGDEGWVQTRQLYRAAAFLELVTPAQSGRCLP